MIITVDLVRSVLHAAVADVVADQLAGDAIRGVAALELRRVVAAGYVLHTGNYSVNANLRLMLCRRQQCSAVVPAVLHTMLPLSQSKLP